MLAALETMPDAGEDSDRRLLSDVLPVAREIAEALRESPAAGRVEIAGSARRWAETCKDIDLVATAEDPAALVEALGEHALVSEGRAAGDGGAQVLTHAGLKLDLRIVPEENFGNLLQHFTGSAEHNVQLRERALGRGLSVSEHGVAEDRGEEGPPLHRGGGRLRAPRPSLHRAGAARGQGRDRGRRLGRAARAGPGSRRSAATSIPTRPSRTAATRSRRWPRARGARGYAYFAITDHSASHGFGDHVTPKRLAKRIEEVRGWNESAPRGFRLLAGSEVNIGTKGELDYPDELLAELDWVVASVHTSFGISERAMTERVLEAMEHPLVDCIGHLTGRLLLRREPYAIDVERIAETAARTGTMMEINGNPNRRDLSERHAKLASEAGVRIVCNTDAHGVDTLANMQYSVATARRAWLSAEQVANTRSWRSFAPLRKRQARVLRKRS